MNYFLRRPIVLIISILLVLAAGLIAVSSLLVWDGRQRLVSLMQLDALIQQQSRIVQILDDTLLPIADTAEDFYKLRVLDALQPLTELISSLKSQLDARYERHNLMVQAVVIGLLGLLMLVGGLGWLLYRRFYKPTLKLSELFSRLARCEYLAVETDNMDPLITPVFESYNRLVTRLEWLESSHRTREEDMDQQIRTAAKTLLSQRNAVARAERLADIGEVAAGLAHEIRNPLAAIRAACSSLWDDVGDEDHRSRLQILLDEIDRLSQMVNRELDKARHDPESQKVTNINELLEQLVKLVSYQLGDNVRLKCDLQPNLICRLPPDGLRQAVLNLLRNSAQEMEARETGIITISARREDARLLICVQDDGPGLPQKLLDIGIRPFASYRIGGTGLGLAAVRRYVREIDGDLQMENPAKGGASITLYIPCRHE